MVFGCERNLLFAISTSMFLFTLQKNIEQESSGQDGKANRTNFTKFIPVWWQDQYKYQEGIVLLIFKGKQPALAWFYFFTNKNTRIYLHSRRHFDTDSQDTECLELCYWSRSNITVQSNSRAVRARNRINIARIKKVFAMGENSSLNQRWSLR